ncbi:hypothetical protein KZ820_07130 [Sphingomonas sp. RRHST34]|uniref:Hemerythrin-like domain-containing protein n=1 Tax=Sphingomonas citri TaxID=2862499 RepID=A0ABS7BLL8_9SPHN|nr:hypothetical protein [Sphingomonas citri]MBW6530505.1 hypothetical protein [Sphingomonas citri]
MLRLAEEILVSAAGRPVPCMQEVARLRLLFARVVNRHCNDEEVAIETAVRSGAVSSALATAVRPDVTNWRTNLAICNGDWPAERIARDACGFASGFGVLIDALRRHVLQEGDPSAGAYQTALMLAPAIGTTGRR